MAVQLETTIQRFRGLSTDEKPIGPRPVGATFTEIDTGARYVWTGEEWLRQEQTIEGFLAELIDGNALILAELATIRRGHEEYLWEAEAPDE